MDNGREILKQIFSNLTGDINVDVQYLNKQASFYQDSSDSTYIIYEIGKKVNSLLSNDKKKKFTDQIFEQYINKQITREQVDELIASGKIDLTYYISRVDDKVKELEEKRRIKILRKNMEEKIAEIELKAKLSNIIGYMNQSDSVATEFGTLTQDEMSKLIKVIDTKLSEIGEINGLVNRINKMIRELENGIEIENKEAVLQQLHHDVEVKLKNLNP